MADSHSTENPATEPANQDDAGAISSFAEEARLAFELFQRIHTMDNRTPREMFYHGYYAAKFFAPPVLSVQTQPHRWRYIHKQSGQKLETIDIVTAANLSSDVDWERES